MENNRSSHETARGTPEQVPVFQESMAGALIDSARISVMAALSMLPPLEAPLIVLQDEPEDDPIASAQGCLDQAMSWLDAARNHTIEAGAPVTSLHVASAGARR